ncbi:MAG: hypothetical protein JST18_03300 [Bacteroidetes bacterium]|nr:hypothetical protein [Bacteroidota bacterium]
MKHFAILLLALTPILVTAQQPASPDPLRNEMDAFKAEMQAQMKALQDSIASLQHQLEKARALNPEHFDFSLPEGSDFFQENPSSEGDHSFNFDFRWPDDFHLEMPDAPELPESPTTPGELYFFRSQPYEFHYSMPPFPDMPDMPGAPRHYRERNRMDDFFHMLPFYDWFKS